MRCAPLGLALCLFATSLLHAQQPSPSGAVPAEQKHVSRGDQEKAQREFVAGGKAVSDQKLDAAIQSFERATVLDPNNRDYDAALSITRDNRATQLMQKALKARLLGDDATWRTLAREAAATDSRNPMVMEHQAELLDDAATKPAELVQVNDDAAPLVVLTPKAGRQSFHLVLSKPELIRKVMSAYGITPSIDTSVNSERVRFDAEDVNYDQAEQMLTLTTGTFVVPLDPQRALLATDKKENRTKYERLALETVYLPGTTTAELNDIGNIARNVFEASQVTVHEASSTLTVRAPGLRLRAFNHELTELMAGRSETMLDVDIYEVQTQRMAAEGAELPQTTNVFNVTSEINSLIANNQSLVQQIISSGLASPGNIEEIAVALILSGEAGSSLLSQPFAYFGGGITTTALTLSQSTANLQLNSSDTRVIDQLQLRLTDQEEGTVKIGERYPIVTSSYSNLATGSTSIAGITSAGLSNTLQNLGINLSTLSSAASASVPQVQYQDIGLTLTATPRVQQGHGISLKLRLQLSSLSGQTLNSNPIINNRENNSIIDVKPGEKTILFSQLSRQESNALIGLPVLSEIPGFTFGTNKTTDKTVDHLIIFVTPHIVRLSHKQSQGELVLLPTHS